MKAPVFADDCAGPKLESKTCGNMPCDISKYKHIIECEPQSIVVFISNGINSGFDESYNYQ